MSIRRPPKKKPAPRKRTTAKRAPRRGGSVRPWATYLAAAAAVVFVAGLAVGGMIDWAPPAPTGTAVVEDAQPSAPLHPPLPPHRTAAPPSDRVVTAMVATKPPAAATPAPATPQVRPAALMPDRPDDAPEAPAWRRYAVPSDPPANRPMIAIVIDDLGVNRKGARDMTALPGPLTMAFMTYADDVDEQAAAASAAGHELLVHFPMEPSVAGADPGPNALLRSLDPAEIRRRLDWGLSRFDGYVGVNNHMGSAFTADADAMRIVLEELDRRGLLFLDSRTTPETAGPGIATRLGLPFVQRDVFLDNEQSVAAIAAQLATLEAKARDKGWAVGIGHPHPATVAALEAWLPGLEARGFTLVPLSTVVAKKTDPVAVSGK